MSTPCIERRGKSSLWSIIFYLLGYFLYNYWWGINPNRRPVESLRTVDIAAIVILSMRCLRCPRWSRRYPPKEINHSQSTLIISLSFLHLPNLISLKGKSNLHHLRYPFRLVLSAACPILAQTTRTIKSLRNLTKKTTSCGKSWSVWAQSLPLVCRRRSTSKRRRNLNMKAMMRIVKLQPWGGNCKTDISKSIGTKRFWRIWKPTRVRRTNSCSTWWKASSTMWTTWSKKQTTK